MDTRISGARAVAVGAVVVVGFLLVSAPRTHGAPKSRDPDASQLAAIQDKLDAIESNQIAMMKTLDTVLEELRIIKVRASR